MHENTEALIKMPTGIEGFDHLTMGGLPKGRTCLIAGSSGSGKTVLGMEFLYRGISRFGRKGVFVSMEERTPDIMRNVSRMGWGLHDMVARGQLRLVDAGPDPIPIEESGTYDLSGLLVRIEHAVEQSGAELLVLDSIGSLFDQFDNVAVVRREIFRIIDALRNMGITAILTAERLDEYGRISRHGVEEFVSDTVIILRNVLKEEKCRRTIQVLKMRGDTHYKGEYPFTINAPTGISILPLSARELKQSSSTTRISFGNQILDQMAGGGLFRDSIFLVSGPTGGGKTLLATTFAAEGCRRGEKVLLLAYEESHAQLLRNAQSWGLDFQKWEEDGLLRVMCQYPESMGLEDHLLLIQREIEKFRPKRLIMDSVSAMERMAHVRFFREFVIGLTSFAKQEEVCSLFTSTTPKLSGGDSVTEAHISTITDAILLLRYVEINGILRRGVAVIKMRGSQHDKQIREFTIDDQGLHIGKPFTNVQNIILGIPSATMPSEVEQLGAMFED
ncbi:MAG: circadian clock protein KaiC [Magnetococcales bacterium]|nr:circadian clock protein KaiC [Magnetococcales bacterium]